MHGRVCTSIRLRKATVATRPHCNQTFLHAFGKLCHIAGKVIEVTFTCPLANAMLQDIPRPRRIATRQAHSSMQSHSFRLAIIDAAVQDVVVVKYDLWRSWASVCLLVT